MASPRDGSRFMVRPDPPIVGQPVEVTYIGPAEEVEWVVDGNDPVRVRPDKDGKFKIDPLPGRNELMLTDNRGLPGYLYRRIIDLLTGGERRSP